MNHYIARYGTSYRLANYFFPTEIKHDVIMLYAFVRVPDNIVDSAYLSFEQKEQLFDHYERLMWSIFADNMPASIAVADKEWVAICTAMHALRQKYTIPDEWIQAFFDAMYQDLSKDRYDGYADVQDYMYGSAEVIGLMMTRIIGYDKEDETDVFYTARLLGEAMQYTNFLRDVLEDFTVHGRIYMPADRLAQCNLSHKDVVSLCKGDDGSLDRRKHFMSDQIAQCRALYQEANTGIALLHPHGRKAVWHASRLYEAILTKIEKKDYDVFTHDVHTTKREKICTLVVSSRKYPL